MKVCQIKKTVEIPAGNKIQLTPEQASVRVGKIAQVDNDIYVTLGKLQFKAGEIISLNNETFDALSKAGKLIEVEEVNKKSRRGRPSVTKKVD